MTFIGLYDETLKFTPVLNKQHGKKIVYLDYIKIPSDSSVFNKFSQVHGLLLLSYLGSKVLGSMLTKLSELIELIGLAELIKSTNQPFNPINLQSLTFVLWLLGSEVLGSEVLVSGL